MRRQIIGTSVLALSLFLPIVASAQGVPEGMAHGAAVGHHDAGPVGAVVGGVVGGAIGGVNGVLGIHHRYHRRCRFYHGRSVCRRVYY